MKIDNKNKSLYYSFLVVHLFKTKILLHQNLFYLDIKDYQTFGGETVSINLSYEVFGPVIGDAPVVMVNHALTGNSHITGENGWWSDLIGPEKVIDTYKYTVICFNIPGNGYDGRPENLFENHKIFTAKDIARIFLLGLEQLGIKKLYALVGGSLGGGIAWELAVQKPQLAKHLVVIATDWKATDWVIANRKVQEAILLNSSKPLHDARMHAMIMYRTPDSFALKFNRSKNEALGIFNIESWLLHHGNKLEERFELAAYKQLNYIISSIDASSMHSNFKEAAYGITADILLVSIDSDALYTLKESQQTLKQLKEINQNVTHQIIRSIHGHDAFLIEFDQLGSFVYDIFN